MNDSYSLLSPLKTFSVKEISCSTKLYQRFRYTLGYAEVAYPDPDEMSPVRNSLGQKLNSSKKKITATDHNTTIESDVATLYKTSLRRFIHKKFYVIITPKRDLSRKDDWSILNVDNGLSQIDHTHADYQLEFFTKIPSFGYVSGSADILFYDKDTSQKCSNNLFCGPGGLDHLRFCLNYYPNSHFPSLPLIRRAVVLSLIASIETQRLIPLALTNFRSFFLIFYLCIAENGYPSINVTSLHSLKDMGEYINQFFSCPLWFKNFLYYRGFPKPIRFVPKLREKEWFNESFSMHESLRRVLASADSESSTSRFNIKKKRETITSIPLKEKFQSKKSKQQTDSYLLMHQSPTPSCDSEVMCRTSTWQNTSGESSTKDTSCRHIQEVYAKPVRSNFFEPKSSDENAYHQEIVNTATSVSDDPLSSFSKESSQTKIRRSTRPSVIITTSASESLSRMKKLQEADQKKKASLSLPCSGSPTSKISSIECSMPKRRGRPRKQAIPNIANTTHTRRLQQQSSSSLNDSLREYSYPHS